MSSRGQIQTHDTVVRVEQSSVDSQVGRRTRVRLHVNPPGSRVEVERVQGALLAEELEAVDVLVAAVVAGVGLALCLCVYVCVCVCVMEREERFWRCV